MADLRVPRAKAHEAIAEQIERVEPLLSGRLSGPRPREVRAEIRAWRDYNRELLRRLFTTDEVADDLLLRTAGGAVLPMSDADALEYERGVARSQVEFLRSLLERLELYAEAGADPPETSAANPRKIFLVHGHDHGARDAVARFLGSLDLEVVILEERPSRGQTIIEKIEANADVGFAVVLLTADDTGKARSDGGKEETRARQNVLLELGYFVGRLGRSKVCALKRREVSIPSDILGVAYVPFDDSGSWRTDLAKELRAAGIGFDAERLLER